MVCSYRDRLGSNSPSSQGTLLYYLARRLASSGSVCRSTPGFTLLETLCLVVIFVILGAVIAPGWVSFTRSLALQTSQDKVFQLMRQAQQEAIRTRTRYQASFRELDGVTQIAIHPISTLPAQANWESLPEAIEIDESKTTLFLSRGVYRVQFNHRGRVNGRLGRLTLMRNDNSRIRRCVVVSTLLGALRKDVERRPRDRDCSPRRS